ncbi:sphingomyelin phosphodiesterase [Sphingomonas naphthae]|uniref:Sphingomyelin phosphodiesterase n=1 Tax=Sphingomonas naphthae TaxID=1813468 RepID=A0ABY7TPP2_9SPHN|nr:sphingomyelin phosphodiesterase [Sphingomonas naphthae]WCT75088.1 sphingomyelin phosphodiesterase [Sphingomonas naphthae]
MNLRTFATVATVVVSAVLLAAPAPTSLTPIATVQMPVGGPVQVDGPSLSVLTYNVEGLPFPVRFGRADAAQRIAGRLAGLRVQGAQPHVVVLQEAFSGADRTIAKAAGYRYVANGPDRDMAGGAPESDADRAFARGASWLAGERSGKWLDSGVAILSDYPIVAVKRAAFPAYACAGFDCLANKGVVMAMVRVPGSATPVAVIATHLNSKAASGVSKARFTYAFTRQVDTIGAFLRANLPAGTPYVLAGDTNIGKSTVRRSYFNAMLARLPRSIGMAAAPQTALATCFDPLTPCLTPRDADARTAFRKGKDLQVYAGGLGVGIEPVSISVPFGRERDGTMLSDHVGYVATYRLTSPVTIAAAAPVARRA